MVPDEPRADELDQQAEPTGAAKDESDDAGKSRSLKERIGRKDDQPDAGDKSDQGDEGAGDGEPRHDTPRKRESAQEAINRLTRLRRKAELDARVHQERADRLETMLHASNANGHAMYEQSVNDALAVAEKDFREAYESGDGDKLLAAEKKLAPVAVEHDMLQRRKASAGNGQDKGNGRADTTEQQPRQVQRTERAQGFIDANPWLGDRAALANDVHELALDKGLDVDSDDYFQEVTTRFKALGIDAKNPYAAQRRQSSDQDADDTQEPAPAKRVPAAVAAPSSRGTAPGSSQPRGRSKALTAEQIEICRLNKWDPVEYSKNL